MTKAGSCLWRLSRVALPLALSLVGCTLSTSSQLVLDDAPTVRARLLDQQGEPARNTPIKMVLDRWPARTAAEAEREDVVGSTDAEGFFAFGFQRTRNLSPHLEVGESCSLWADVGDGWRLVEVLSSLGWDEPAGEGEAPAGERLELQVPPRDLEFRFLVRDGLGLPLEGATIRLLAGEYGAPVAHQAAGRTGSDGTLHWPGFAYGRWWVDITCPGYAPMRTCPGQFRPSDDPSRYYGVTLRSARELTVAVVDEAGLPAIGARIVCHYENEGLPTWSTWTQVADEHGEAVIALPSSGGCVLEAQGHGRFGEVDSAVGVERIRIQMGPVR